MAKARNSGLLSTDPLEIDPNVIQHLIFKDGTAILSFAGQFYLSIGPPPLDQSLLRYENHEIVGFRSITDALLTREALLAHPDYVPGDVVWAIKDVVPPVP